MSVAGAALAAPAAGGAAAAATGGEDLKLGVASYSFREFSRGYVIRSMKQLNIAYLNIKERKIDDCGPWFDTNDPKTSGR